jgi:hypothetical protein
VSHDHYKKDVSHLKFIDPYRIADLYGMDGGPIEHAFKKMLCAGMRGHKSRERDVQDAIDSLLRWQEMQAEDAARNVGEFGQKNMITSTMRGGVMHARYREGEAAFRPILPVNSAVEWPEDETRIDAIGQNGNGGEHYEMVRCCECAAGHCHCEAA